MEDNNFYLDIIIIIPAYEPTDDLINFCLVLKTAGFMQCIIIDDGSGEDYKDIFDIISKKTNYIILRNAVNLGKGRALKSGFNYVLNNMCHCLGVVTCDSDGQHSIYDIIKCAEKLQDNPNSLILGYRNFQNKDIPWKSRIGNNLTRLSFRYLCGLNIKDTQTGLRAMPMGCLKSLLYIPGERFDYETNMLLEIKNKVSIIEFPISTIYESKDKHRTHFDPIRDSLMIYRIILSYFITSVLSTVIDFMVFTILTGSGVGILTSTGIARLIAAVLYFSMNKQLVFKSKGNTVLQVIKYLLLVVVSGTISAYSICLLSIIFPIEIIIIKFIVDTLLFFFNYYIQRTIVFTNKKIGLDYNDNNDAIKDATNWTAYYRQKKSWVSMHTQKMTMFHILNTIDKYIIQAGFNNNVKRQVDIMELGGGNSCFVEGICNRFPVNRYDIVDNNAFAVMLFDNKIVNSHSHRSYNTDLLSNNLEVDEKYDFVFSVGLIEHFHGKDIEQMINRHFDFCKDGGVLLITFPTPTIKYHIVRRSMELLHLWQFHDEKPIAFIDVKKLLEKKGIILNHFINRRLPLTQEVVIIRKNKIDMEVIL